MDNQQAFSDSITDALNHSASPQTPLLSQEEIEDQDPPRVNLTAVICTAIVAVCATIILLVAQPWKGSADVHNDNTVQAALADTATTKADLKQKAAEQKALEEKAAQEKAEQEKAAQEKAEQEKAAQEKAAREQAEREARVSSLPVVKTTPTGTGNIYNNIRLIDASSRLLTKAEVEQMTKEELALARNSIYARHGYQFNNPDLKEFFAKQSWFKPTDVKIDAIPFTQIELDNIRLIKSYEQP